MLKKIIIGFFAGLASGLFATGGGLILVPAFVYLLKENEQVSRATSIFCILPMVIVTAFFYGKGNYIHWKIGLLCALGGIARWITGSKTFK